MARGYWLVKSEPFKYSWDRLVDDGRTYWDGVRNYEARNNLAAMKKDDLALYYHSNVGKEVVGVARIVGESYQDPTTEDERWVVVDLEPVIEFAVPVGLSDIKDEPALSEIQLVTRGRLSVIPITPAEFERVLAMGRTVLPAPDSDRKPGYAVKTETSDKGHIPKAATKKAAGKTSATKKAAAKKPSKKKAAKKPAKKRAKKKPAKKAGGKRA